MFNQTCTEIEYTILEGCIKKFVHELSSFVGIMFMGDLQLS